MWYLAKSINDLDLVDTMNTRTQAAMHAENLIIYNDGEGEVVEHIGEIMPNARIAIFARALSVEAVGLCYAAGLVVATDEVHAVRVAEFKADEEGNGFYAEEAAVYIVAEEQIVCVGAETADAKDFEHVEELAMDVADDGDRCCYVHHITLLHKELFRFGAYGFDDRVGQELLFVEPRNTFVEVDGGR